MAYTPDPTDVTQPTEDKFAKTAAAEFRALKAYIQSVVSGGGPGAIPPGSIWEFPFLNPPPGFVAADGSLLSRTTFAPLFALANADGLVSEAVWAGGAWGRFSEGDGVTNFRIPDFRGEFRRGAKRGRTTVPAGIAEERGVFSDASGIRTVAQDWAGSDIAGGPWHIGITSIDVDSVLNPGAGYPANVLTAALTAPAALSYDNVQNANQDINPPEGVVVNNYVRFKPRSVTTLVCIKT